jgi:hypothetical protein
MKTIIALLLLSAALPAQNRLAGGMRLSSLNNHNAVSRSGLVAAWDMGSQKNLAIHSDDFTLNWNDSGTSRTSNSITFGASTLFNIYRAVPMSYNTVYTVSALVSSATSQMFRFALEDASVHYSSNITTTSTPTKYSATITTGASGTTYLEIYNGTGAVAGSITISNLQLELGSLPTAYQATTDLQTLPNLASPGTYDLQRGSTAGADSADPTVTGNSWLFDGSDDYAISSALSIVQPSTIMAVGKRTAETPITTRILIDGISGRNTLYTDAVTGIANVFASTSLAGQAVPDNTWFSLVGVFNSGAGSNIYNGSVLTTGAVGSQNMIGVHVGTNNVSSNFFWYGAIAQVLIYNTANTGATVWRNYKALKLLNATRGISLP